MDLNSLLLSAVTALGKIVQNISDDLGVWYLILVNAFGVIAIIIKFIEYQLKGRNTRIAFAIISAMCWALYFIFQANITSSISSLIVSIGCLIFMQREKHKWAKSNLWLILFLTITTINCIIGFRNWFDIFSIMAGLLGVTSYFVINDKIYRFVGLAAALSWLFNSIFNGYVIALVSDITSLVSVSLAIIRLYLIKKEPVINNDIKGENDKEKEQSIV